MKLREKLVLLVVIVVIGASVAYFGDATRERCEAESVIYLAEAKRILADDLETEPGCLTVYWSGEYVGDSQYRYRYRSEDSGDNTYVGTVYPRLEDYVIENEKAREFVARTVTKMNESERWATISFLGLVCVFTAITSAILDLIMSFFGRLVTA